MTTAPLTLPELARAAGVRLKDAKHYLRLGVLQPARRTRSRSGDKAFHQEHVERLRFIRQALDVGFSIENVATLVKPDALSTCGDVYDLAQRRIEELRAAGQTLAPAILEQLANTCARTGSRDECALLAVLRTGHKARAHGNGNGGTHRR